MNEKVKRFDPIEFYDMGGSGRGQMELREDGDYVEVEAYEQLQRELGEVEETKKRLKDVTDSYELLIMTAHQYGVATTTSFYNRFNKLKANRN